VPGEPLTEKKRQRFSVAGKVGSRVDTPDRSDYKAVVRLFAKQAIPEPLAGPVEVNYWVYRVKPASTPKKPTQGNPWPWAWWKRPDAGNYEKLLSDALTGVAWLDDGQIVDLHVHKRFGLSPRMTVQITTATDDAPAGAQEGE